MRLAFFGSSENSLTVFKELVLHYPISLVVTAPPRPVGRKKTLTKTKVHVFAQKQKMRIETPEKLDSHFIERFKNLNHDLAVVADYRELIPQTVLSTPAHGFINLHPSLLPRYRGSTPAQTAILMGDKVTGLTIMEMDEKFDTGKIISWFKEEIKPDDTGESLYRRLFEIGSEVLIAILPSWVEGNIVSCQQTELIASHAPRLTREDGFIAWKSLKNALNGKEIDPRQRPIRMVMARGSWPQIVERAVRAYHPWPGIWTEVNTEKGKKRLKLISTGLKQNKLVLNEVQLEGKNPSLFSQIKNQLSETKP